MTRPPVVLVAPRLGAMMSWASASSARCPLYVPDPRGEDTVQLQDAAGVWLRDVTGALTAIWWEARRAAATRRRPWLATLYPAGMAFDWSASTHIFRYHFVEAGSLCTLPTLRS